jgi:hypothetical protein
VRLDIVLLEMGGILGFVVEDEQPVHEIPPDFFLTRPLPKSGSRKGRARRR